MSGIGGVCVQLYGLPIDDYFIQHEQQIAENAVFTLRYIIVGTERYNLSSCCSSTD